MRDAAEDAARSLQEAEQAAYMNRLKTVQERRWYNVEEEVVARLRVMTDWQVMLSSGSTASFQTSG